jgi:CheY-like chemotaxis protein
MHRVYEIFEVMPNGTPQRVTVISGVEFAKLALLGLAKRTKNECFAADAKTRQVVMYMNVPRAKLQATKRVFQIAYDEDTGLRRAELLRSRGYAVISVTGNQPAKLLLSSIQHYDLFIVGHAAPEETRREIVDWLKGQYPKVKILVLNPPDQQVVSADYNVKQNGPAESWLLIVTQLLERRAIRRLNA